MRYVLVLLVCAACDRNTSPPPLRPDGPPKQTDTKVLAMGAEALQSFDPTKAFDVYLDGFHVMKDRPDLMMEAHHYCHAQNEELMQCVIFDGNTAEANLIGVEYIIADTLFEKLPADEKPLWHPHNYEILSGTLVAPGLPDVAERAFLAKKINSYGKTWHIWDTGHVGHPGASSLPTGQPLLAWSFNADGEMPDTMRADRDARLHVDTAHKREDRRELARRARPQAGVDALAEQFPNRRKPSHP